MRAVLDPNVLISALLSPDGTPASLVRAWAAGSFELVVSSALLEELERALAYPRLRRRITLEETGAVIDLLARTATVAEDPPSPPPVRSEDPADDYLIALAFEHRTYLVSGDRHLTSLAGDGPILTPAGFAAVLDRDAPADRRDRP